MIYRSPIESPFGPTLSFIAASEFHAHLSALVDFRVPLLRAMRPQSQPSVKSLIGTNTKGILSNLEWKK
jgi:hypothetical protein